jgi:hypothetical protein
MCPTTLYRLGGDLGSTIRGGAKLRDLAEYDVLDELLIADGALTNAKYKSLIVIQPDFVEDAVLDKIEAWVKAGGRLILRGDAPLKNIAGEPRLTDPPVFRVPNLDALTPILAGSKGVDGKLDGCLTCRRGDQVFILQHQRQRDDRHVDFAAAVGRDCGRTPHHLEQPVTATRNASRAFVLCSFSSLVHAADRIPSDAHAALVERATCTRTRSGATATTSPRWSPSGTTTAVQLPRPFRPQHSLEQGQKWESLVAVKARPDIKVAYEKYLKRFGLNWVETRGKGEHGRSKCD